MSRTEKAYSYAFYTLRSELGRSPTASEILTFFNGCGYEIAVENSKHFSDADLHCDKHACPRKNCDCGHKAQDHIEKEVVE